MSYLFGLVSMVISLFITLTFHPFSNEVINAICFPFLSILYAVLLVIAQHYEDKLEKRIKTLEKKLEDIEKAVMSDGL